MNYERLSAVLCCLWDNVVCSTLIGSRRGLLGTHFTFLAHEIERNTRVEGRGSREDRDLRLNGSFIFKAILCDY